MEDKNNQIKKNNPKNEESEFGKLSPELEKIGGGVDGGGHDGNVSVFDKRRG